MFHSLIRVSQLLFSAPTVAAEETRASQSSKPWSSQLIGALLCVAPFVSTAARAADDLPLTISPLLVEPDRNGVNILTGKMTPDALTLSAPGSSRLRFDRIQNAAPYITGRQHKDFDGGWQDGTWTVHTADGSSEGFRCAWDMSITNGKSCEASNGSGSALTFAGADYRRAGSGEHYNLDLVHVFTAPAPSNPNQDLIRLFYASSIDYPDGERIAYTYKYSTLPPAQDPYGRKFFRPTKISSNVGYYITIAYQYEGDDLSQTGWGTPSQVQLYNSANVLIGQLTYSGNTTTDLLGRTYQGFSPGTLGVNIETASYSQTLPTEASPTLTVTPKAGLPSGAQMVGTVNRDGVAWNYSYVNPVYYSGLDNYLYDSATVTGPNGFSKTYRMYKTGTLSPIGNRILVDRVTNELGKNTDFQYDSKIRVIKMTMPELNAISATYDDAGNVITKTTLPKSGAGSLVEQLSVNLAPYQNTGGYQLNCNGGVMCWRPQWYRDALNRQTDYVYNSRGQLTEKTEPADVAGVRRKTYIAYEEHDTGVTHIESINGVATAVPEFISRKTSVRVCGWHPTNPALTTCGTNAEFKTEYAYWGHTFLPILERVRDLPSGTYRDTTYAYDAAGRPTQIDGPRTDVADNQFFRYDIIGRKTWEIGKPGTGATRVSKYTTYRNSDDKVLSVETGSLPNESSSTLTALERTDFTYDSRRNPIREAASAGGWPFRVTDRSFLDRGMLECETVRMNLAALPAATATGACALGAVGTDGYDRITKNTYDAAAQLTKTQEALLTTDQADYVAYSYTPNGKREFITDANGNKAQFKYDTFDRQSCWIFPHKTAVGSVSGDCVTTGDYEKYTYDNVGNRTSLRKRDGNVINYTFDGLNQMTAKSSSAMAGVAYTYDMMGRQLTAKFATGGEGVTNLYNGFGDLVSSSVNLGGTTRALGYQYNQAGSRIRITHPDGVYFTNDFDSAERLYNVGWYTPATGSMWMQTLAFDNFGRRQAVNRGNTPIGYGYDAGSRIATLTNDFAGTTFDSTRTYAYVPASQIRTETRNNDVYSWTGAVPVNRPYAVNGLNQYTTAGSASFTYDPNGNLTADGTNTYVYDVENRLTSATTGGVTTTLSYDPVGRLWRIVKGGSDTRFLYDGDQLAAEFDGAGTVLRRYYFGPGVDELALVDEGSLMNCSGTKFALQDHQGSVVALAGCGSSVTTINTYDEYGIPGAGNASITVGGRFQFTGQAWIPELGMYYYKARFYSPTLGRFMQTDPIGYEGGVGLYVYASNDPLNSTDPTGLYDCPQKDCDKIEAARKEIVSARASYLRDGPKIGTRINTAANALGSLLNRLGTMNDGKGPSISIDNSIANQGEYNDGKIVLNEKLSSVAGNTLGHVLAHEGTHYQQDMAGLPVHDNGQRFWIEYQAILRSVAVDIGNQHNGELYRRGMSADQIKGKVKRKVEYYCHFNGPRCEEAVEKQVPALK